MTDEPADSFALRELAPDIFLEAPCGIAVCEPDGRLRLMNRTLKSWIDAELSAQPDLRLQHLLTTPGRIYYETHLAPMLQLQGFVREIACQLRASGGEVRNVLLNAVLRPPAGNQQGRLDVTLFDATERAMYEKALREARQNAEQLAAVVRSSPNAILRVSNEGEVLTWNAAAERLFDTAADVAAGRKVQDLVRLDDEAVWFAECAAMAADKGEHHFEAEHRTGRRLEVTVARIGAPACPRGECDYSVVFRDVTARADAERHLKLVVAELKHRVKNTLSVVSAIARQTFGKDVAADLRDKFSARLSALARAHDLLSLEDGKSISLLEIIKTAAIEAGGPARFSLHGPDVGLPSHMAVSLSMALHELNTNAMKYGALSNESGRVSVVWSTSPDSKTVELVWEENGGPAVETPKQSGFGTLLITRMLSSSPGCEADIEFRGEGVRCRFTVPYGDAPPPTPA